MQRAGVRRIVCDHSSQKHRDGGDFDFMEESKEASKADIEPISEGKAESGERRRGRRKKEETKKTIKKKNYENFYKTVMQRTIVCASSSCWAKMESPRGGAASFSTERRRSRVWRQHEGGALDANEMKKSVHPCIRRFSQR